MQPLELRPLARRTSAVLPRDFQSEVRVARSDEDAVRQQGHSVLGDNAFTSRDAAELAREHRHERRRQMLGHEDRNPNPLGQRLKETAERMDAAGRSADREEVDRVGRHGTK